MYLWEDLPVSVGANLISHWITNGELHKLDRACCSQGSREAYLSYCNNSTSNNQVELHNESKVNWYLTRRIKFSAVKITEDIPLTSLNLIKSIDKLLELNAAWIIELSIGNNLQDSSIITKIVQLCVNINCLDLAHFRISSDIITLLFQGLTKITSLTLDCCNLTQEHINLLKERKYKLIMLSLSNVNKRTSDIFLSPLVCSYYELQNLEIMKSSLTISKFNNLLKYCHNMQSLTLDDNIDISTILAIVENCPNLTSLILDEYTEYNITDDDLLMILTKCPQLTVLELSRCSELTNKSLSKISNFTELRLEHCIKLTSKTVIELIKRNLQLTDIDFSYCHNINMKSILKMLELSKNLTNFVMFNINESSSIQETTHDIMVEALKWRYPKLQHICIYIL